MKLLRSLLLIICCVHPVWAGITLNATRVIYNEKAKDASITINASGENRPYLVQSWLENSERNNEPAPFVITPPLFKLMANTTWQIRITKISESLPRDRESLFWLSIKAIPASDSTERNRMLIATKSVLKLIWRPETLDAAGASDAVKQVTATSNGQILTLHNPTPYVINIGAMRVNGKSVDSPGYIAPFSSHTIRHTQSQGHIELQAINDYGGLTAVATLDL
ncbi:molecular chaperone [Citrobacter amalonaticus]|uniref:Molecular chaperone n=1 Tax=Citrobacter amalonaticus TaxID=35703 RepID=A0A9C7V2W6_CITAM|nr:molecular chaperone [Citrobacter amalonaticus]HCD1255876.1 molecular chaperone [Citrobacter amalonaticus]